MRPGWNRTFLGWIDDRRHGRDTVWPAVLTTGCRFEACFAHRSTAIFCGTPNFWSGVYVPSPRDDASLAPLFLIAVAIAAIRRLASQRTRCDAVSGPTRSAQFLLFSSARMAGVMPWSSVRIVCLSVDATTMPATDRMKTGLSES
jgi:hypothetical protein